MPAPIYIPRRQNPWTNMMPGLLQNLVLQKIGQNMRLKEKEMEIKQRDIEAKAEKEERADLIKFQAQKEGRSVHKYNDARGERHFPEGSVTNPLRPTEAFGAKPDVSSEYVETNVPNVYIHPQTGKTIVKPPPAQAKDDRTPLPHDAVIQSGLVAKKLRGKPPGAYKIDKTITVFWDGEALSTEFPEPAPKEESSGSIWPWSD
jgi:hypothetical protein